MRSAPSGLRARVHHLNARDVAERLCGVHHNVLQPDLELAAPGKHGVPAGQHLRGGCEPLRRTMRGARSGAPAPVRRWWRHRGACSSRGRRSPRRAPCHARSCARRLRRKQRLQPRRLAARLRARSAACRARAPPRHSPRALWRRRAPPPALAPGWRWPLQRSVSRCRCAAWCVSRTSLARSNAASPAAQRATPARRRRRHAASQPRGGGGGSRGE